jgi:hypothetical protein
MPIFMAALNLHDLVRMWVHAQSLIETSNPTGTGLHQERRYIQHAFLKFFLRKQRVLNSIQLTFDDSVTPCCCVDIAFAKRLRLIDCFSPRRLQCAKQCRVC